MVKSIGVLFLVGILLILPRISYSATEENLARVESILHRICDAVHLPEIQRPAISLYESGVRQSWAYYHESTQTICMNRVLFGVLREEPQDFIDNTLAMIIGHELAHHIQRTSCKKDGYLIPQSNQLNTRYQEELDADYQGVFSVFLAGYRVDLHLRNSFEFLIGQEQATSASYPTKQERILAARSFFQQIDTALIFYQLGLSLIELQQWDKAGQCLERVYALYQGREIGNSLAVIYMYEGLPICRLPISLSLIRLKQIQRLGCTFPFVAPPIPLHIKQRTGFQKLDLSWKRHVEKILIIRLLTLIFSVWSSSKGDLTGSREYSATIYRAASGR